MRVCHLADLHLGYRKYNRVTKTGINQREADINIAFHETIDRIIRVNPDLVLIAGDIFHTVRPSNNIVTLCFRELRRLTDSTKAPVVIIAGNHDTPKRSDTGCLLRLFTEIPNIYVADNKAERFLFKELDTAVFALPHSALAKIDEIDIRADDSCKINILMAHGQIEEKWMSEFGGINIEHQKLKPHEWDYIALGHVHVPRQVGNNGWYCGAIEHTSSNIWSECNENKGFLEVTLPELKVKVHSLTSVREVVVAESINGFGMNASQLLLSIIEKLENTPGGIEGKIIKLEVVNVLSALYRQLHHKELKKYRSQALHLQLEVRPPRDQLTHVNSVARGHRDLLEADLKNFIQNHQGVSASLRDDILSTMERYIHKLSEASETSLS